MLLSVWSYGQNVTVQGKVTDASTKETVPFASLLVKGTSSGTSSDLDGSYVLSVPRNATLIVSSLGYRTVEVAVEGRSRLDIALEPDTEFLEDVVITAQGLTRKQKALGYSTQKVTSEELTIARQSDLSNAIVGKVAGVQFFGGSGSSFSSGKIVLRGAGTLSTASGGSLSVNEPIYVVDGTITNKNAVNMDDVESINVLKGPAATALYGSRGGDGAIIITTKSAESGKGTVDFSHTTTVETYYNHVNLQTLYGGGQYGYLFGEATGTTSAAKLLRDYPGSIESLKGAKIMDYGNDASWGPRFDPSVKYVTPLSVDPTSSKYGIPDTWESHLNLSDLYKTGVANITNIAFSKSYRDLSTRVSFTNNQRTGIQPNSDAIRRNLSIKANYSPASWLDVSLDYLYTYRRDHNPASSGYNGNRTVLQEYTQWGQTNVNLADYKDYMRPDGSWRSWNVKSISNNTANYHDNPYALFHEYNTYDTYQWNVFSADATVKLPLNIKAGVRYNANIRSYIGETKRPSGSINFTSYYAQLQSGVLDDTVQGHLTWGGSFVNDKLSVEAAAFAEARNYQYDELDAHTNSSYDLSIDNFYNLSASTGTTAVVTNTKTNYAERSIYGTATVGWDDTYYIDGSLRNDWSSTLSPENNSYLYGGLSVSVIASNWFSAPWLNMWKIRASAAQLGSSMGAYNIYPTYTIGTKYGPNSTMYETATQVNYNIKPTISTSYEVGTEWKMFGNRFYGDINFYNRDNDNQIINASSAAESGYSTRKLNAGLVRNRGMEFLIGARAVETRDFSWDLDFNIARNVNTLVRLTDGISSYQMYWTSFYSRLYLWAEEGRPLGIIRGNTWERDEQGRIIFDEDGYPTFNTAVDKELGCYQPDFTGGFSTRLRYKGFSLAASLDFSVGGQISSWTNLWGSGSGLLANTATVNDKGVNIREPVANGGGIHMTGVDKDGKEVDTYVPAAEYFQDYASQVWETTIFDRTYVKLREVSLSYDVPKSFLSKMNVGLSAARVSFVATNPWLIYSAVPNIDPSELGSNFTEGGAAPSTRAFGMTLKLTF